MDNQHKKIKGYRDLSQEEIDLMNEIKEKGVELEALTKKLREYNNDNLRGVDIEDSFIFVESFRWVDIGQDHLQQGLMALTRSVAKPTFF